MKFNRFQSGHNLLKAYLLPGIKPVLSLIICVTSMLILASCTPISSNKPYTINPNYSLATSKVWCVSDMYRLSEKTRKFYDDSHTDIDGKTVLLNAAANETVSFQIILDSMSDTLTNIRLSASDFISQSTPSDSFKASSISFYKQHSIVVSKFPAWYLRMIPRYAKPIGFYDALEDITNEQNLSLNKNSRLAVWVDLPIPKPVQGGNYKAEIAISTSNGELKKIPIKLHVHNFILPDAKPFRVSASFDHRDIFREFITLEGKPYIPVKLNSDRPETKAGIALTKELIKRAHKHKIDLFDRNLHPRLTRNHFGKLKFDWSSFDIIAKDFLTGKAFEDKIPLSSWAIPVNQNWPAAENYGSAESKMYRETIAEIARETKNHFAQLSASDALFAWPCRNLPRKVSNYKSYLKYAKIIRAVSSSIPCMTHLPVNPPSQLDWAVPANFKDYTDIYAPPAELATTDLLNVAMHKSPLAGHWLIPNTPPYLPTLEQAGLPADARSLAWFATKYKCKGIFLPAVLNWSKTNLYNCKLFYSGKKFGAPNKILSSIRLKRFRRGMQDVCYLWILRQQNMNPIAKFAQNAIARYAISDAWGDNFQDAHLAGWQQDIHSWSEFKPILARKIESNFANPNSKLSLSTAEKQTWRNFFQNSCQIKVERIYTTLTSGSLPKEEFKNAVFHDQSQHYRATITLELFNQFPANMKNVKVQIFNLPEGWIAPVKEYKIVKFPAGGRRSASIAIEGLSIPVTADGKIPVKIAIFADSIPTREIETTISILKPAKTQAEILVDGAISEWKIANLSQASNFKMLGNLGKKNALARKQTLVYSLQDGKNLYFAFKCETSPNQKLICNPTNFLTYDQLLIKSEDVVEIVLNPNGSAITPADLLHFVIKSNGAVIQHKGIACSPRLGKFKPLAVNSKVAVKKYKHFWIAEIAIPKSEIPKQTSKFWKVNFSRYDTANIEASNWAGVWRYYYNPSAMGTLLLK